jgi:8-oxo-dGTP pyrophosphatase MutT (NUDIX family)
LLSAIAKISNFNSQIMSYLFIQNLKQEISESLPGKEAQYLMAPEGRLPEFPKFPVINGSVLLLLFHGKSLRLCLIKRSDYIGPHGGQVSFPGGKFETGDSSLVHTALRESSEEIGIQSKKVEILGTLTPLFIPPSSFNVLPVVGYHEGEPEFRVDPREVNYVFTPELSDFLHPQVIKRKTIIVRDEKITAPYYAINGEEVWGATAMILSEFLEVVKRRT